MFVVERFGRLHTPMNTNTCLGMLTSASARPPINLVSVAQRPGSIFAVKKKFPRTNRAGHFGIRAMSSKQDLHGLPGVCAKPDESTQEFIMQQTNFRIKDPVKSLDFYTRILGMTLLSKLDFPSMQFSLYFLGYNPPGDVPEDEVARAVWTFRQKATLELTHNYGTESDPEFKGYHNGNSDPRGFGHIGLSVPDVEAACKRFEELGVEFIKRPDGGKMKGLAFIKDPDGYWVEILNAEKSGSYVAWKHGEPAS